MRTITIVLIAPLLAACHSGTPTPEFARLRPEQLTLNGARLGQSDTEIRSVLGTPMAQRDPVVEPGRHGATVVWQYQHVDVGMRDGHVVEVSCYRQKCQTADGVAVGDSVPALTASYGPGLTVFYDNATGFTIYRQIDRDKCALRVEHDNGIVNGFRVACM